MAKTKETKKWECTVGISGEKWIRVEAESVDEAIKITKTKNLNPKMEVDEVICLEE